MAKAETVGKSKKAFIGVLAFFLIALFILVNVPIRMFVGNTLESVSYTDLQGASFLKGDLWLNLEELPGLTHLVYSWCPGPSLLSWCVDLQHSAVAVTGNLAISGLLLSDLLSEPRLISLSDMEIRSLDIAALGIASGLVDARINGRIDSMRFALADCPMNSIEYIDGQLSSSNIQVFGISAGSHQVSFTSNESVVNAQISGNTFLGNIQLIQGQYNAEGEMTAPEAMAGMAQSFMRPLGNNRFGWQISGDLPC